MNPERVFLAASLALLGVSLAVGEQEKGKSSNREGIYAELESAPEKARVRRNPFAGNSDAILAGRKLFERHCAECHGTGAEGGQKAPSLRATEVQSAPDGAIFWLLTNGVVRRGMPVWSKLPEPQRWQLVTYLKSLGAASSAPSPKKTLLPDEAGTCALRGHDRHVDTRAEEKSAQPRMAVPLR